MKKLLVLLLFMTLIVPTGTAVYANTAENGNYEDTMPEYSYVYETDSGHAAPTSAQLPQSYDSYMEAYFRGLTENYGKNAYETCGYVAGAMLLSYYDSYLNDDIVGESYDVKSKGAGTNMIVRNSSPGVMHENIQVDKSKNEDEQIQEYFSTLEMMESVSLQAKLYNIGRYIRSKDRDKYGYLKTLGGTNRQLMQEVLTNYLVDRGFFADNEFIIKLCEETSEAGIKSFVKEQIDAGYPVYVTAKKIDIINGKSTEVGHAAICYDYSGSGSTMTLYTHMGTSAGTYYNIEEEYPTITGAFVLKFEDEDGLYKMEHTHSYNYEVTQNGKTTNYCYCNSGILTTNNTQWKEYIPPQNFDGYLVVPNWVTGIDESVFKYNSNLKTVKFEANSGLTVINKETFANCTNLTSVTIPASVTSIGQNAFYGCSSLESVVFESGSNLTCIAEGAFEGTAIEEIILPESIEQVASGAFWDCEDLKTIRILKSVNSGEITVFEDEYNGNIQEIYPSLESIIVPDEDSYSAYMNMYFACPALKEYITCDPGPFEYELLADGTYAIRKGTASISGQVIIPGTFNTKPVTHIADNAFANCSSLRNVQIPSSVTEIGDYAFEGCKTLTNLEIPYGVTRIGRHAFANIDFMWQTITIPGSVVEIADYAFYNCDLMSSIQISNGVQTIGNYAFARCVGLQVVSIPGSVTSIGKGAFAACRMLSFVSFSTSETNPQNIIDLEESVFDDCQSLGRVVVPNDIGVYHAYIDYFESQGFYDVYDIIICETRGLRFVLMSDKTYSVSAGEEELVGEVVIPATYNGTPVTKIDSYGFENCTGITSVFLPSTIEEIGVYAFSGCTNLTWVEMQYGLKRIDNYAFTGSSIEDVVLPTSLEEIGNLAFGNCESLGVVVLRRTAQQGITEMYASSFDGSDNVCFVVFDEDSYYAYYDHFISIGREDYAAWLQFIMYL